MKRRISLALFALCLAMICFSNDIVRVSTTYEYVSNNPNETPDQAKQTAISRAKMKALEEAFGLDVSSVNTVLQRNKTDGKQASSSSDMFSLRETSVHGEWIADTCEPEILTINYQNGFWMVKVRVEGKARNHAKEKTDIRYALINNTHDRQNRDQYLDGDDVFLRFSSPVNGSLCVYLVDEEHNAFCLLPYPSVKTGSQPIEANKDYLFFSQEEDRTAEEYTLNSQHSSEQNVVYIVYTPNILTKANDRQSGTNWRDEPMPRQLAYKDFIAWLAKNQTKDEDMVVKTEVITIRKP